MPGRSLQPAWACGKASSSWRSSPKTRAGSERPPSTSRTSAPKGRFGGSGTANGAAYFGSADQLVDGYFPGEYTWTQNGDSVFLEGVDDFVNPEGRRVVLPYAGVLVFRGPLIAQWRDYFDRNLFIFPNLILISTWRTVRTFYPVSHDYIEVDGWGLFPKSDSPEMRRKRLDNFLSFQGPGGFATPDDVSGLEGCQRGFASVRELQWSDISRGMAQPEPTSTDELQMRAFWREWHRRVSEQPA